MVPVEIMASQAGLPSIICNQRGMGDVDRIGLEGQILVAGDAKRGLDESAFFRVLCVASEATVRLNACQSFHEAWLVEAIDRMTFVWPFMAIEADARGYSRITKVHRTLTQSQDITHVGLGLLPYRAGTFLVTPGTADISMAMLNGSRRHNLFHIWNSEHHGAERSDRHHYEQCEPSKLSWFQWI